MTLGGRPRCARELGGVVEHPGTKALADRGAPVRRVTCSRLVLATVTALELAGCASSPPRPAQNANLPGTDACFWTRDVYDWTVLDDSTLIVNAPGPGTYYLVKLFAPIPDLSFRMQLGFESKGGLLDRFCRDNGYVITRGVLRDREPVVAVQSLSRPEAMQLLAKARDARSYRGGPGDSQAAPK